MNGTADSNQLTREYFDSIVMETRYIDSELPNTKMKLWGEEFDTPIMTAALSHLHNICDDAMTEFAEGAKLANAVNFVGMGEDDELEAMLEKGAKTIKIVKPHENNETVIAKLTHAAANGAFAVGMDIDHSYNARGGYDVVCGLPMKPKSLEEMKEFVSATDLPFVVKGVLSVQDAVKSVEAGAKGIIVSHHHGIMPYSIPPLMALPKIKEAVGDSVKIFVDCGIESGVDVFKCLALGADAVCVGRALMDPLKDGAKGVADKIVDMNNELASIMARTGIKSLAKMDSSVLHFI